MERIKERLIPERHEGTYKPKIDFELNLFRRFPDLEDYYLHLLDKGIKVVNKPNSWVAWATGVSDELPSGQMEIIGPNPPDVDLDFSDRDPIVEYMFNKYGEDHTAMIGTFQTIKTKNAIKDIQRIRRGGKLEITDPVHQITKRIPTAPQYFPTEKDFLLGFTDSEGVWHEGYLKGDPELEEYLESEGIKDLVFDILGKPRSLGKHAGGIVITKEPIDVVIPTRYDPKTNKKCTQVDHKTLEKIGGLKYDLLGVTTLKFIRMACDLIKKRHGTDINAFDLPHEDEIYTKYFHTGNVSSVFQFDTNVIRPILVRIKPNNLEDLAFITAVGRPGCLNSHLADGRTVAEHLILRRTGEERVDFIDPILEGILSPTYGLPVYQEQIQKIFEIVGGLTPIESDNARRGIGKKILEVLNSIKGNLREGAQKLHGWAPAKVEELWKQFEGAANYAFNKAHSVGYGGYMAYACAWLKHHYPLEWWCAVLTHEPNGEQFKSYISEIGHLVVMPHVNISKDVWTIDYDNGKLIAPISEVEGVGPAAVAAIMEKAPFTSFRDFHFRCSSHAVRKNIVEALIWAGCFSNMLLEDGGEVIEDDPEKLFSFFFDLHAEHHKKKKADQIDPEFQAIDRVKKIRKRVDYLSFAVYDYVNEFLDLIQAQKGYAKGIGKAEGTHYLDGRLVIRNFDKFGIASQIWRMNEVAIVGIIKETKVLPYGDGKKRMVVTIENMGKFTDTIIWDKQLKQIREEDFEAGNLIALYGPLEYDNYSKCVKLKFRDYKKLF